MDEILKLRRKLEEKKEKLEKEGKTRNLTKKQMCEVRLKYDRKIIQELLPEKVDDTIKDEPSIKDNNIIQFKCKHELILTSKNNLLKTGFFSQENIEKIIKNGEVELNDISVKEFQIIMEYIRTKKLQNIGLPDDLKSKKKLLKICEKYELSDLTNRLKILCFVQELNCKDLEDVKLHTLNQIQSIEKKIKTVNSQNLEFKKMIFDYENRISSLKSKPIDDIKKDDFVILNVGGKNFKCFVNKKLENWKGSYLYKKVMEAKQKNTVIFLDHSHQCFEKIHSFVYNIEKFLTMKCDSQDSIEQFNQEIIHFLNIDDKLRYPVEKIGFNFLQTRCEEDIIRTAFINDRKNPALDNENLLLIDMFNYIEEFKFTKNVQADKNELLFDFENNSRQFLQKYQNKKIKVPKLVKNIEEFKNNFKIFSSGLLEGLDYSNIFIAGGAVLANCLDYGEDFNEGKKQPKIITQVINPLEKFKENENLVNFSKLNLDEKDNKNYINLLKLPISSILLRRLINISAEIESCNQYTKKKGDLYNGIEIKNEVIQFLSQITFKNNKFLYKDSVILKFVPGIKIEKKEFLEILPKDYYPLCISENEEYLFYTELSYKNEDDMKIFIVNKNDKKTSSMDINSFISSLIKFDIENESENKKREKFFQKNQNSNYGKSDIDLFIYGVNQNQAVEVIRKLSKTIENNIKNQKTEGSKDVLIIRTKYALTFQFHKRKPIQIILRIYKSPTEILSGFDIDSCTIGFDGQKVLCLPRFKRAYNNRINLIDIERMSTTYELRLFKYAKRGFRVYVPGYNPKMIKREGLLGSTPETKKIDNIYTNPTYLNTTGLARLLFLEKKIKRGLKSMLRITNYSDYEGDYITLAGKLRRSNPMFVERLLIEKKNSLFEKYQNLKDHANFNKPIDKMKVGMIFSMNNIENVIEYKNEDTSLPKKIIFLIDNPGTQKKLTGSFQPITLNFYEGCYLSYKEIVDSYFKKNFGRYLWWYSVDGKKFTEFAEYTNKLIEEGFKSKYLTLQLHNVIIDYKKKKAFFLHKDLTRNEEKICKIVRLKDYFIPN